MPAPALDVVLALTRADAALRRRLESALGAVHGLGLNDFVVLSALSRAPGQRLRRIDLADAVGVTASAVTRMLVPLEQIGLVERDSDPKDARAALARLTAAGLERVAQAQETAGEAAGRLVGARLSTAETATLARLLGKLVD